MLDLAREKAAARGAAGVRFEWADALQLPYDAGRFDAVTVGFGVRNLADLDRGLREMARVLKPGGRAGDPRDHPADAGRRSRPSTRSGSTASCRCSAPSPSDPEAYSYLPESVRSFPSPRGLAEKMDARRASSEIRYTVLAGGIIAIHSGVRRVTRPLGGPAAGDGGARRLEPLAAGPAGRGRGAAARADRRPRRAARRATRRRPWRPAASGCGRCWSCSAPARTAATAAVRAATAIELVHMATLVHDDVLDEAPLRRGQPTVAATSGRDRAVATGDLLFSRAFALLAERRRRPRGRSCSPTPRSRWPAASWPSATTPSTSAISEQRYLERCRLKTATLFECACLLGRDDERLRRLRRRDRPRLPAARRRPRRRRPAGADRQGARHRPARRHRDPAADRGRRGRSRDPRRSTCAASTPAAAEALCDRIAATGALERSARGRWRWSPTAKRAARRRRLRARTAAAARAWSPTASSSATAEPRG